MNDKKENDFLLERNEGMLLLEDFQAGEAMENAIKGLFNRGGTDLFIEAGAPIVMRIDGRLHPLIDRPIDPLTAKRMIRSTMTQAQREEYEEKKEINYAYSLFGVGRVRISAFKQRGTDALVARVIQNEIKLPHELGLPKVLENLMHQKNGLILFVGGTGTGKSTSLASMIEYRNQEIGGHIITIEDPIEYIYKNKKSIITQREVGVDTDSFDIALKNTLRQAPDVILIGEIRDKSTMENAIKFSETGHLCLSTLHANNAIQTLDRIINFFEIDKREQLLNDLSNNIRGIISQRLLPKKGGGRIAAVEILLQTSGIKDKIKEGDFEGIRKIMEKGSDEGMQTFDDNIVSLFKQGLIDERTAIQYADSQTYVKQSIKLNRLS